MKAEHHAAVRALFDRALALAPDQRAHLLDDDGIEPEVRAEARALLSAAAADGDPIAAHIADAAAAAVPSEPARIGPWRVCGVLGEGGMGVVLLGERDDGQFAQRVAIKRLRGFAGRNSRERLLRERALLAQLDHPHIARLLDGGTTADGEPYLVMQLIEGLPLSTWALASSPSLRQRVVVMIKVCRAVHHAHQHLIVHRDLKPDNILVRDDGEPALLDFGIAKLFDTADGEAPTATRLMTPAYASPEQLQGRSVTTASDVFTLGVILYELLAGVLPPRGESGSDADEGVPPPSRALAASEALRTRNDAVLVRGDLDRIVRKSTRGDPASRYESAEALASDLGAWLDGRAVRAVEPSWRYLTGKFVRRHRLGVGMAAAALASIVVLSLLLWRENLAAQAAQLAVEREAATANEAAEFLQSLFSEIDPRRFPGRRMGALELLDVGRERLDAMTSARPALRASLALRLAALYANAGRPDRALEMARAAKAAIAGVEASSQLERDIRVAILGSEFNLSHWPEASALADGLLSDARAAGDRATEARVLQVQGQIAQGLRDFARADTAYGHAHDVYLAMGDAGTDGVDAVAYARAVLAQDQGKFPLALERYRASFDARRRRLGNDHPDTLESQLGVAMALNFLGQTASARELYGEAIAATRRVFGSRSEATAYAIAAMATADRRLGRFEDAEHGYREAIAIHAEIQGGEDSVKSADQLANLARLRQDLGDLEGAQALNDTALQMRLRMFGPDSTWVALSYQNRADFCLDRGDLAGARAALDEALRIRRAQFEPGNFLRLISEATLVILDARAGSTRAAIEGARPLRGSMARAPFNTRLVLLQALAAAAEVEPNPVARIAAIEEELDLLRQRHPESHPLIAFAQLRLAEAHADAGRADLARPLLRSAQVVLQVTQVPASPWLERGQRLSDGLATRPRGRAASS